MQTIGTLDDVPLIVMDADVATSATVRSVVFQEARQRGSCSVELHVTGVTGTVNATLRPLGQNSVPAADPTRLLQLPPPLGFPDLSALTADYHGVFLVSMYTAYFQLEVQSNSGALVHVQAIVRGANASFEGVAAAVSSSASHVVVDSAALPTGASTSAKQAALGTAGTPSADVLTMQGAAGMTPVKTDGSAVTQPVSVAALPALSAGANKVGSFDVAVYAPYVDTVAAADTSAHAYGTSQIVKTPVFARAHRLMLGTVTITDGTRAGGTVLYAGDPLPVHVTNLNQITYQFSQTGTNEKLHLSAGV